MDPQLKTLIRDLIITTYPDVEQYPIILMGSRALGLAQPTSDIDTLIFVDQDRYEQYLQLSIERGDRKAGEEPGMEPNITYEGHDIGFEVKFATTPQLSNLIDYFSLVNAVCLNPDPTVYDPIKQQCLQRFEQNYEKFLMKAYILFFQLLKDCKGILEKDPTEKRNQALFIQKGILIESFLKLMYVMEKEGYPTVKRLLYLLKGERGEWAYHMVEQLRQVEEYQTFLALEKEIKEHINETYMPKKPYVGVRWMFLGEFKKL